MERLATKVLPYWGVTFTIMEVNDISFLQDTTPLR